MISINFYWKEQEDWKKKKNIIRNHESSGWLFVFPPSYNERISYYKIYLQELQILCQILTSCWVAVGSAVGDEEYAGSGWRSWAGPGMDLVTTLVRNGLVKRWWFCSHWGLCRCWKFPSHTDTTCCWQKHCLHIASEKASTAFHKACTSVFNF